MKKEKNREEISREIYRKATIKNAENYFDFLHDKHLEDSKEVKIRYKSKDGKEITVSRTEYSTPFQIQQAILTLNDAFETKIEGLKISRENLSSIEIFFE